jgi:hypothetical protein
VATCLDAVVESVIGNGAATQLQFDISGALIDSSTPAQPGRWPAVAS